MAKLNIFQDGLSSGHASDLDEEEGGGGGAGDGGHPHHHHPGDPGNNPTTRLPFKESNMQSALKMKFQSGNSCNRSIHR